MFYNVEFMFDSRSEDPKYLSILFGVPQITINVNLR